MATTFMKQAHGILRDAEVKVCELIPKALLIQLWVSKAGLEISVCS